MQSVWNAIGFMMLSASLGSLAWVGHDFLDTWKKSTDRINHLETRIGDIEESISKLEGFTDWLSREIDEGRLLIASTKESGSEICDLTKITRDFEAALNKRQADKAKLLEAKQESD